ncbi:MAG: hypothetical protein ABJN36_00390 [Cyclobacteriaceae bacterium]
MQNLGKHFFNRIFGILLASLGAFSLVSCDSDDMMTPGLLSGSFTYEFHNGQTVPTAAYDGTHSGDLSATLFIEDLEEGGSIITVTLMNTVDGETYMVHAHDAADASTTPNGTPYDETPNGNVLVQMAAGNGGTVSVSQTTEMTYAELTESYEGFFVVHDPFQSINTADITTYLVVGAFAREQTPTSFKSETFMYDFNTGQLVADYAYAGTHATDLEAMVTVQELAGEQSRITVDIMNTLDGEMYPTHAHDMADAETTPNGTPYNESPNGDVFVNMIAGNGATATGSQISTYSYSEITASYDGFFVIHDPLQAVNTADPTTYVVLGVFAR